MWTWSLQKKTGLIAGLQIKIVGSWLFPPRLTNTRKQISSEMSLSKDCKPLSFLFYFSRKIKESLECFPVKLNNLIHTLAQMTAISPAKSTSQNFPQESCMLSATRSIQRATILRLSNRTSSVSLESVILI